MYLANDEIQKLIQSQAKLKKYRGIVYINRHLSESICYSFKKIFAKDEPVKIILIDNGQFPKHEDIMGAFDEVIFFERFKRNKIVECEGIVKTTDDKLKLIMDSDVY